MENLVVPVHGLNAGDRVFLTSTGTLPTGLDAATDYFVLAVDADKFQVALNDAGTAVDIGDAGTGVHAVHVGRRFTANASDILAEGHAFQVGDKVFFSTTGTLPAPLTNTSEYFVHGVSVDGFRVSAADPASAPPIDITDAGAGVHTAHVGRRFAATSTTNRLGLVGHGFKTSDRVLLTTTGTLPAGLSDATEYYVLSVDEDNFQVAMKQGGTAVEISDAGTGEHSVWNASFQIAINLQGVQQESHTGLSMHPTSDRYVVTITSTANAQYGAGSLVSGRGFGVQVRYGDDLEVFDQLSMTPENARYFVQVMNGDTDGLSYVERRRRGHSILVRVEDVRGVQPPFKPVSTPKLDRSDQDPPQQLAGGGDGFGYASVEFPDSGGSKSLRLFANADRSRAAERLRVSIEPFQMVTALTVPITPNASRDQIVVEDARDFQVGDVLTLSFTSGSTTTTETRAITTIDRGQNLLHVASPFGADFPIGSSAFVADRFDLLVFREAGIEPVERHRNLSRDAADTRWFHTIINAVSQLLCADDPGGPLGPVSGTAQLSGGTDPGEIRFEHYTGYDVNGNHFAVAGTSPRLVGLAALENVEEVSLVAIPDLHRARSPAGVVLSEEEVFALAQRQMLRHCEVAGDRFALLDPPMGVTAADIEVWPLNFVDDRLAKNGALYFPWITGAFEDARRQVPPCGFVAGQIADSDRRSGVGKAPANSKVKGAVALHVSVDRETQRRLNLAGVNCLRKFADGQIRLFGARTLSRNRRFAYVNVRRVVLSVVKALTRNMVWAVFEPNDERLQRRIESTVTSYLSSLVAKGMTATPRPQDSFYVKSSAENNPREVRNQGQIIAEIGLAIARPQSSS